MATPSNDFLDEFLKKYGKAWLNQYPPPYKSQSTFQQNDGTFSQGEDKITRFEPDPAMQVRADYEIVKGATL